MAKSTILLASALSILSASAQLSGSFDFLAYNVAGLPEPLSSSEPKINTPIISSRIGNYSIVNVQEDFNYHAALYASDNHPHRTPTSGGVPFGSGLNTLSDFPYHDLDRVTWDDCWIGTGDCLTPKGFSALRVTLAPGAVIDVYNLHADAGDGNLDIRARQKEFAQLSRHIATYSAGNAVILGGDTNTRYTRDGDPIRVLSAAPAGLTDVWIELIRKGDVPPVGPALGCPFPDTTDRVDCELIDKIFYRSSPLIELSPQKFQNMNTAFLRPDTGGPLSDHFPINVPFDWTLSPALRQEKMVGGYQGDIFNSLSTYPARFESAASSKVFVKSVSFRAGNRVDQFSFSLSTGQNFIYGGNGGDHTETLTMGKGEVITEVEICEAKRKASKGGKVGVFYARVGTSKGRALEAGKKTESGCEVFKAKEGWGAVGFAGATGKEVERLGVYWGKV